MTATPLITLTLPADHAGQVADELDAAASRRQRAAVKGAAEVVASDADNRPGAVRIVKALAVAANLAAVAEALHAPRFADEPTLADAEAPFAVLGRPATPPPATLDAAVEALDVYDLTALAAEVTRYPHGSTALEAAIAALAEHPAVAAVVAAEDAAALAASDAVEKVPDADPSAEEVADALAVLDAVIDEDGDQ